MPDLIAQGVRRENRWRKRIPAGEVICIGRSAGAWSIPWDDHVSRQHIKIRLSDDELFVESLPRTSNPVFFQGTAVQTLRLRAGEHFVIGNTSFTLASDEVSFANFLAPPATEQTFSHEYLRHIRFRDPEIRLSIVSNLPEKLATAAEDTELFKRVMHSLFQGIPHATDVAICMCEPTKPSRVHSAHEEASRAADQQDIRFLCWDSKNAGVFNASQPLILDAIRTGQSVIHTWSGENSPTDSAATVCEQPTWAFCIPFGNSVSMQRAIYVAGKSRTGDDANTESPDLREDMKFAEIVGSTLEASELRKRQTALGQFFAAPVIRAIEAGNANETLAPREVDATVLFCDLRGFSRATEQFADDLQGLLRRVSDALGVLTRWILHEGGVIGDFHGDAAMGFWGWPLAQNDAALRAARAALQIFDEFRMVAQDPEHSLREFRIGVGIASGRVVAGKIGTVDQVKVTAFGPAVNLASRLEGMTKRLSSPILIDKETATQIDRSAGIRLRRLAIVQPYGMQSAIEIYQLLPNFEKYPLLTDDHIRHYEVALDAFVAGDWETAWGALHEVPAADTSKDFLTTYIASRSRRAPTDWDGVIRLEGK